MSTRRKLSRRDFALAAGAIAAVPELKAQEIPTPDQATIDAKVANVIRKYGDRLSDAQRTRIREIITRHQRMLMRVRDFPLENSDSTATGLRLYPRDQQ
jgi:hypothetical protein